MMAKMTSTEAMGHKGMKSLPAPCCMKNHHTLVAVVDQRSPESQLAALVLPENPAAVLMPSTASRREELPPIFLRSGPRTQAFLSMFLI
jgi:hypothetical protein